MPPAASAQSQPEFWSLLGVGQGETVNAAELGQNLVTGEARPSFVNQRELFENLLYAAPDVETAELGSFFKPAEFGVAAGEVTAESSPRPGVRIVRDDYAIGHVYGETRADTMWGAGWVAAEDRLFFMDVLRHTARGELTELTGPGPEGETLAMDAAQLGVTDYREQDLEAMIESVRASGSDGAAAIADLGAYVDGVNAYIEAAQTDPSLLPAEYPALGLSPKPWRATDTAAIAGLLNGYFGIGGGAGLEVAAVVSAARKRFGAAAGRKVVADFRNFDDPEAPVTTAKRFEFDDPGRTRRAAVAMPRAATVKLADPAAQARAEVARTEVPAVPPWLEALRERGLGLTEHASNAIAIPAGHSASGHPLLVAGPQVDFYSPEIFYEIELHGPGIEARGAALPGAGPFVIVGHGDDYAWSITTAQGDNTDVFAERLCEPDGSKPGLDSTHYIYRGRCIAMLEQDRRLDYTPPPTDPGVPQSFELHLERSVHGPIVGRAMVGRRPAAFSLARASYMQDADVILGFARLNDPAAISGPGDFQRAAAPITGSFNFFYVDARHASYIQSGIYPRRAQGTSPDLPNWGTGRWDWRGFDPGTYTADYLGFRRLPKDTDPERGYLVSWNNRQAPGWRASDADWQYGPVHRSQRLERRVRRAERNGKLDLGALVGIMGDAATVDVRGEEVYPWLRRAIGRPGGELGQALALLDEWSAAGSHRRDLDRDGFYDQSAAVALMDAWWDPMTRAVFKPALGPKLLGRIAAINPVDYKPMDGPDTWYYGWMSYVQKDLRALLGRRIADPPSRVYCGKGSLSKCKRVLRRSLRAALAGVESRFGGLEQAAIPATCPVSDPPQCDQLDFFPAGAIETPPTPWQDRGTFQQAVEIR